MYNMIFAFSRLYTLVYNRDYMNASLDIINGILGVQGKTNGLV